MASLTSNAGGNKRRVSYFYDGEANNALGWGSFAGLKFAAWCGPHSRLNGALVLLGSDTSALDVGD